MREREMAVMMVLMPSCKVAKRKASSRKKDLAVKFRCARSAGQPIRLWAGCCPQRMRHRYNKLNSVGELC